MLAIIDGDILAYQACRPRKKSKFNNDDEFQVVDLDEDPEAPQIIEEEEGEPQGWTAEEDAKYLEGCWDQFHKDLNNMVEKLWADDYVMAVKGDHCFRYDLFDDYKKQRSKHYGEGREEMVTRFVPIMRKLAVHEGLAIPAHGREADDLIRIWANEARRQGQEYIICSIDKDLRCIPGDHYVMPYKGGTLGDERLTISEDEAMRHYYEQLIKGDPVDNIPGVRGIGPKKAAAMISACGSEADMQECVVTQYLAAYGDEWFHQFLINAKLIHIQTHYDDYFDCKRWPIIKELVLDG